MGFIPHADTTGNQLFPFRAPGTFVDPFDRNAVQCYEGNPATVWCVLVRFPIGPVKIRNLANFRYSIALAAVFTVVRLHSAAFSHVFLFAPYRIGAIPHYPGNGWVGEAFLNIPEQSAAHLLTAESYVIGRQPDFTFRTEWIDFPAGPIDVAPDTDFETIGDFLNDYIYDVSDPSKLDEPFGQHMLLRFSGYLRVAFADTSLPDPNLPVWVEFGTSGYDGYRLRVHDTIYRLPIVDVENSFYFENCITEVLGMYPIQFTYFNRYDPDNAVEMDRVGIELYSWHGGGLPWPAGNNLVHPVLGPATIVPPRVIYQEEDIQPLVNGDFEADSDLDLRDAQWLLNCFSGDGEEQQIILETGCFMHDFDKDVDVDLFDYVGFFNVLDGPGVP